MAEETQDQEKTEDPTERRRQQAREKGQVAKSQEVGHWFMILAFAMTIGIFLVPAGTRLAGTFIALLENAHDIPITARGLGSLFSTLGEAVLLALLGPILISIAFALAASWLQNGFMLTFEQVKPKLSNLSLKKGMKKIASLRSVFDLVKSIIKLAAITAAVLVVLWPHFGALESLISMGTPKFLGTLLDTSLRVIVATLVVLTIIMIADIMYQRFQHTRQLRMTKQEVKDEYKHTEGDPIVKSRLRQIRMERARRRMMAAVPEADVVITNPTHFAVALKYDQETMQAPKVTAKGADHIAQRIRELAKEHDVPLVENPPLARALYSAVDLEQEIPPQHYKAVAEVIGYIMRLQSRL